jgi:hypothetical protein
MTGYAAMTVKPSMLMRMNLDGRSGLQANEAGEQQNEEGYSSERATV